MRAALRTSISIHGQPVERDTRLAAVFARRGSLTALESKFHTAPVKIAKAFDCPHELAVIVMDASPGMLEGDRYDYSWQAEAGARVYLTNQSYTKVHPCICGGRAALRQHYRLEEDAWIQSMMEPVMPYRDASFLGETEVDLGRGAVWMQGEVLCPGRLHRGEAFAYRQLDNRLTVRFEGEVIFHYRQFVHPLEHRLDSPGSWENYTHIGSFYAFSDRIGHPELEAVRNAIDARLAADATPLRTAPIYGASLTYRHGIAVSAAGSTAWELQQVLYEAWSAVRRSLEGLPPFQLIHA